MKDTLLLVLTLLLILVIVVATVAGAIALASVELETGGLRLQPVSGGRRPTFLLRSG